MASPYSRLWLRIAHRAGTRSHGVRAGARPTVGDRRGRTLPMPFKHNVAHRAARLSAFAAGALIAMLGGCLAQEPAAPIQPPAAAPAPAPPPPGVLVQGAVGDTASPARAWYDRPSM